MHISFTTLRSLLNLLVFNKFMKYVMISLLALFCFITRIYNILIELRVVSLSSQDIMFIKFIVYLLLNNWLSVTCWIMYYSPLRLFIVLSFNIAEDIVSKKTVAILLTFDLIKTWYEHVLVPSIPLKLKHRSL